MSKVYYISGLKPNRIGLSFNGQPITATSTPVLDGWGWGDYWGCDEWKAWHMELRKQFSAKDAAVIWAAAWNKQDSFANPYNWCKYNSDFRNYMRSQGVNVDSVVSALIMPVFDTAGNITQGAADVAENTIETATTLSSLFKPLAIGALVVGSIWAYKKYAK